MKNLFKFFLILVLGLTAGILLINVYVHFIYAVDNNLLKTGNEIIHKIEKFQQNEARLPYSLSEICIEEKLDGGPIYYSLEGDEYSLSFAVSPSESASYSSKTKKWEYLGKVIEKYVP